VFFLSGLLLENRRLFAGVLLMSPSLHSAVLWGRVFFFFFFFPLPFHEPGWLSAIAPPSSSKITLQTCRQSRPQL